MPADLFREPLTVRAYAGALSRLRNSAPRGRHAQRLANAMRIASQLCRWLPADHQVPAARARIELGYRPRVGYEQAMQAVERYVERGGRRKLSALPKRLRS